jgi:RNA polymerase sigma-70 factor (ECF subfamily)
MPALIARTEAPAIVAKPRAQVQPADEALFERALAGDREALGALVREYEAGLFSLLVRLTNGDRHKADDLFQETFLHAMRAGKTFDRTMRFKPWITAIAVNLVRDDARKRKLRSEVPLEGGMDDDDYERACVAASEDENPRDCAERHDEEERVMDALRRLTDLEREVVLLHFYDRMTLVETATALGVALGTVKSRLHSALTRLSRLLEPPEGADSDSGGGLRHE